MNGSMISNIYAYIRLNEACPNSITAKTYRYVFNTKNNNYKQVLISIKNEGKRDSSYVCINIIYIYIP